MDLLGDAPELTLYDESWRIYSRHEASSPQFVGKEAYIVNSSITEGCYINGVVRNSVIGQGVIIEKGASVCDSVILGHTTIGAGAEINYSIIDDNVRIGENAKVGETKKYAKAITVVGAGYIVKDGEVVPEGAMLSDDE